MTTLVTYIPVLHEGYRKLLSQLNQGDRVVLVSKELLMGLDSERQTDIAPGELGYLRKDIRALSADLIKQVVESWFPGLQTSIADREFLTQLADSISHGDDQLLLTDDDIGRFLAERFFSHSAESIRYQSVFLRWDRQKAVAEVAMESTPGLPADQLMRDIFGLAYQEAEKSSDWWRQVGAVVAKDGQVLLSAFNRHLPSEQQPYLNGDVRALFHKGDHIELTTAIHAEAAIIAAAARQGIPLVGADLFVTTFPCPVCAKSIAATGIKRLYFVEGYAMLDGQTVMEQANIDCIRVSLAA